MEQEINRRIGVSSDAGSVLVCCWERGICAKKAKLLRYKLIYVPALIYGP